MVVRSPETTVEGVAVTGTIEILADHVTVRDASVTTSGRAGHAIWIAPGVRDVVLDRVTLAGADATRRSVQYAVQNAGSASNRGVSLRMSHCTTCWAGPGTLQDSYAISDAVQHGAHYEPVYYGGGGGPLNVVHDTLFNPHDQTADVFASVDFGDQTALTVSDSLLAGGGYLIYGGTSGGHGVVRGPVRILNNRFARCATWSRKDPRGGGYHCVGGADAQGYWPRGGHYGTAASFNAKVTTWSGNEWDSTGGLVRFPR
jgi:hypothetical protein